MNYKNWDKTLKEFASIKAHTFWLNATKTNFSPFFAKSSLNIDKTILTDQTCSNQMNCSTTASTSSAALNETQGSSQIYLFYKNQLIIS